MIALSFFVLAVYVVIESVRAFGERTPRQAGSASASRR
jgi:hypothetical protein